MEPLFKAIWNQSDGKDKNWARKSQFSVRVRWKAARYTVNKDKNRNIGALFRCFLWWIYFFIGLQNHVCWCSNRYYRLFDHQWIVWLTVKFLVTTKLVHHGQRKEIIDAPSEDRTTQDLINMIKSVPRSKAAIVVETRAEKVERKMLAQERRQERLIEQQKIAQHMEDLMEKVCSCWSHDSLRDIFFPQVLRETPLSKKEETNLRQKIKSIVSKVNKELDRSDVASIHPSLIEPTSSTSQIISDVNHFFVRLISSHKAILISCFQSLEPSSRSQMEIKATEPTNQGAFLLWYDRTLN